MLQTLTLQNAPRAAVHGTSARNFESIRVDGLHRGQRQHIHFIAGEAADGARSQNKETSGLRAGSEVMLWIDVHKCLRCGIPIYRAPNDVLLSPGQDGWILPSYIFQVQITRNGRVVEAAEGQHLPTVRVFRSLGFSVSAPLRDVLSLVDFGDSGPKGGSCRSHSSVALTGLARSMKTGSNTGLFRV